MRCPAKPWARIEADAVNARPPLRLRRNTRLRRGVHACALALVTVLCACGSPAAPANDRAIHVWLSRADTDIRLQPQPDTASSPVAALPVDIVIDTSTRYQTIAGFGAAITDASAILIQQAMSPAQRDALLRELFGAAPGLGLSLTRLSIGASDFSTLHYSLDDVVAGATDPDLAHFSIDANRDDVIPTVRAALAIRPTLRVMASPWSAPAWMKTSDSLIGGSLRPEFEPVFARYLLRYVDAYAAQGIPIFALTLQNEPAFEPGDYPGMRMPAAQRARVIAQHLGPALAQRTNPPLLFDWDHNWNHPEEPLRVLADPAAAPFVAGVAWHCYEGRIEAQSRVHTAFPTKDAWLTECSGGEWEPVRSGGLLWLTRNVVLAAVRHWARGVVLWNLALDPQHGPHLGGCGNCRGVVTIDPATGAVQRNDEYYALAHFSRFVRDGAVRIDSGAAHHDIAHIAFQNRDDGSIVLVVVNSADAERRFSVHQADTAFQYALPPRSIATLTWHAASPPP